MTAEAPPPREPDALGDQTDEWGARTDWRSTTVASILLILAGGIWLVVSQALISYDRPALPVIWGVLFIVLSLLRLLVSPTSNILALLTAGAGALAVISAFLADEHDGATANLALIGAGTTVLALIGSMAREESPRGSRG